VVFSERPAGTVRSPVRRDANSLTIDMALTPDAQVARSRNGAGTHMRTPHESRTQGVPDHQRHPTTPTPYKPRYGGKPRSHRRWQYPVNF
jgi:hypothetical protein